MSLCVDFSVFRGILWNGNIFPERARLWSWLTIGLKQKLKFFQYCYFVTWFVSGLLNQESSLCWSSIRSVISTVVSSLGIFSIPGATWSSTEECLFWTKVLPSGLSPWFPKLFGDSKAGSLRRSSKMWWLKPHQTGNTLDQKQTDRKYDPLSYICRIALRTSQEGWDCSPSAFVATRMILAHDIFLWQTKSMKVPTSR